MRQLDYRFFLPLLAILFFTACENESGSEYDRPHEPWVFRSVLDDQPRMVTAALHDDLWVAYHTETGAMYKAWKGNVNFDGAVYTTAHGPQPSSIGNGWFVNENKNPWLLNGKSAKVQYKGHRFVDGQVVFKYELSGGGTSGIVTEKPEYVESQSGQMGLERTFTMEGDADVSLKIHVNSIASPSNIVTDGEWTVNGQKESKANRLAGLSIDGTLKLKPNASTVFTTYFIQKPMVVNENKVAGMEEGENLPLGLRLISRSDCKTCHNTYVATVGPSYVDVAKRYRNSEDNVATLVAKVKNGGAGNWGEAAMTAHDDLPESDIQHMVEWIMSLDELEEANQPVEASEALELLAAAEGIDAGEMYPGAITRVYQYNKGLTRLADIKPFPKPLYEGVVPSIHAEAKDMGGLTDNFAIVAEGYLRIPKDNNYTFRLVSDDGSSLHIDDKLIIDHDGQHGGEPKDGEVALKEGFHPFRIEYFEAGGGNMLSFQWKSFDDKKGGFKIVPGSVLTHSRADRPTDGDTPPFASTRAIPGDKYPVIGVHPSYDLTQARPDDFFPKVGGMDFLSDGRLVVSLWDAEGGVYVIDNPGSGVPSEMTATKIASGLAEPLGLKVVDDEIYILQKQELTKLIDHDGDEKIDEYETICNAWTVSSNFHEFAFGLEYEDGYFYGNLAIGIMPGGASAPNQPKDRGRTFKISKKDGSFDTITQGLRTPNGIGKGVDGELFVSDNQGDWLPSCKILHVTEGAFFNSFAVTPEEKEGLPIKQPVVWLPQDEIGNSPGNPTYINDGPYKGQMIHSEVTHGGVKRVFVEKINGDYQGCLFRFTQGIEAGVNRIMWGPDGALYMGGVGSTGNWQHGSNRWYGLQKMKFNGQPVFEMLAVRAKSNGMEIEFTNALPEGIGWNAKEYDVQQWRYVPTIEYGGPKVDLEKLNVRSANVSADRKRVFLELDGMKKEHLVYIHLPTWWTSESGLELWSTEAWYTLNNIPQDDLGEKTTAQIVRPNTLTEAEKKAGWKLLFDGETLNGWRNFGKETIGSDWVIDDGAIHLNATRHPDGHWQTKDGGDIITDGEYENFELNLEWKIAPCGNSGIIYNVVESEEYEFVWQTGPEMQVLDNTCHPDALYPMHRAGDLYDMIECEYETVNPANEWNRVRLIIRDGNVEHWLNGRRLVSFQMHNSEWRKMIANSKFKDMPGFGKAKKGHLSLQDHGDKVWYRNIKIREF